MWLRPYSIVKHAWHINVCVCCVMCVCVCYCAYVCTCVCVVCVCVYMCMCVYVCTCVLCVYMCMCVHESKGAVPLHGAMFEYRVPFFVHVCGGVGEGNVCCVGMTSCGCDEVSHSLLLPRLSSHVRGGHMGS